jgi:hypothetical protein
MRCYFEKDENAAWRHYRFSKMYKSDDNWFWRDNKIGWQEADFRKLFKFIKESIKPIGNAIFVLTSLIEQAVLFHAKRLFGYHLINVYDEFFSQESEKVKKSDVSDLVVEISNRLFNISNNNPLLFNTNINYNLFNIIMPHDNTTTQNRDKYINDNTTEDNKYINGNTTTPEPNELIYINDNTTTPIYINEVTTKAVFICPADGQPCENCTCGATKDRIGGGACNQAVIADVPDANVILPDYDRWGKILRR